MELLAYKATGTDGHCVARIITLWILLKRHPEHTAHVVDCFAVLFEGFHGIRRHVGTNEHDHDHRIGIFFSTKSPYSGTQISSV